MKYKKLTIIIFLLSIIMSNNAQEIYIQGGGTLMDWSHLKKFEKDNERLKKIVIEACEQSNRLNAPLIEKPQNLKNFLNSNSMDLIFTDLNSNNKKITKNECISK